MNFTSGIGGMNVERDEFAHSNFNLFENTEYEVGVKKLVSQIFRPLSTTNTTGPFSKKIQSVLIRLQMHKVYVCMGECL